MKKYQLLWFFLIIVIKMIIIVVIIIMISEIKGPPKHFVLLFTWAIPLEIKDQVDLPCPLE